MARTTDQKPVTRKINQRVLVYAADGAEKPYPVYQFSRNRVKFERPGHNPFKNL